MTIEQTIEIPIEHRFSLKIPKAIPAGKAKIVVHITSLENSQPQNINKKRAAFQSFMEYRKTPPEDFDYKKELMEALDEKHGRIG
jgi:hypothetical protein